MSDDLVTVDLFARLRDAEAAKRHLESQSVYVHMADAETTPGNIKLQVLSSQAETASALLRRMKRLPVGLTLLLVYQGFLVLASLFYGGAGVLVALDWGAYGFLWWALVFVACGVAITWASVGMARRRSWGFLVGMICHLLLGILGLVWLGFGYLVCLPHIASSNAAADWAPTFLLFTLTWLPVLVSGWGFFYLRRLGKSLFS